MPPIRKGDGTPVTPKGISQIRTGDGRILFDGVAIADSVVAHYDATTESSTGSISTIEDQVGDNDLDGSCTVIDDGIGGEQAYRFDGTEHMFSNSLVADTEDIGVILVVQLQNPSSNDHMFDSNEYLNFSLQDDDSGTYEFFRRGSDDSGSVSGGTIDGDQNIIESRGHSTDGVEVVKNGETIIDDTNSDGVIDGFYLSSRGDGDAECEQDISECFVVDDASPSDFEQIRSQMANKYGISVE